MQEITTSGRRKINMGNYENREFMVSVKAQVLDGVNIYPEIAKLDEKVELFLDRKEKRIREGMK